jgi:hypothetical protein
MAIRILTRDGERWASVKLVAEAEGGIDGETG